jgi:transcriptional regulator with XRE-family HTH domain
MTFHDLQQRLIEDLRQRVRSGDVTERSLARATGVSQPHMHNVLKGTRKLSVETADQILKKLDMDLLDLIELEDVREFRGW